MSQTLNVHVRINDAATGQPTPARVRFAGPNGEYYAPLGRPVEFPVGRNEDVGGHIYVSGKRYASIDGACEIPLPTATPLSVEISKGPSYIPIRQAITLGEGQLSLRFAIQRWADEEFGSLVHADSRCHFITPHSAKIEAAAEGLDLVNLLIVEQDYPSTDGHMYKLIPNATAFSGQTAAIENVHVNTFNVHPVLGRLGLLHCHRAIFPLTFGQIDQTDDWSLADWCDQCHRKKGLVVWCDAYRAEAGLPGGEALIDAILGRIDAIEIDAFERSSPFLPLWYRLLNAGIRLPIVGGSGKESNRIALGGVRTLTPAGGGYSEWVENVRGGRTVASNGPLLEWNVNGEPFASSVSINSAGSVRVSTRAKSIAPFERLELIVNGDVVVKSLVEASEISTASLDVEHVMTASGWIAVRCWGAGRPELYPHIPAFAHTSPCFVHVAGTTPPHDEKAIANLNDQIARVREWVVDEGRFTNPRRREHLVSLCNQAAAKLEQR